MLLTMPTGVVEGTQLTVMPFRDDAVVGTLSVPALVQLVPSPRTEEDPRKLKTASGLVRRHAELRATVQRTLKSSQKGKNVRPYAEYIAAGLKGELGAAWSTPPITLWHAGPLAAISDELVPGSGLRTLTIAPGTMVVAIDGETQTAAWHDLYDDPEPYGLTYPELARVRLPFELYVDLAPADARQIFYDRNVRGVVVAKNLAMSMDQRDFGTRLAHRVADSVKVDIDGQPVPFGRLVNASKRQTSAADREVVTLSALRALVVTAIYGRSGLTRSAESVHEDELPAGTRPEEVEGFVVPLLARLISERFPDFASRSALTAPAVLAGVGIAAHHTTPWSEAASRIGPEDLDRLLGGIRWEREAAYWDGVAAKTGASGRLNFSGGVKDSGGRVADATSTRPRRPGGGSADSEKPRHTPPPQVPVGRKGADAPRGRPGRGPAPGAAGPGPPTECSARRAHPRLAPENGNEGCRSRWGPAVRPLADCAVRDVPHAHTGPGSDPSRARGTAAGGLSSVPRFYQAPSPQREPPVV
ncbi:DNA sulfur modification protein DndB [Streptomyces xinghaiensis]|uniref:DNA sulfur modification protein DndB n=1 Tax=Streptomyces xinghaiensis TaxID=1038928 RepID=UPI002E11E1C7|nr:hypothetical protein OG463_24510 [Streptomyces xinghaiensis]